MRFRTRTDYSEGGYLAIGDPLSTLETSALDNLLVRFEIIDFMAHLRLSTAE